MNRRSLLAGALALLGSGQARGEARPKPGLIDPRVAELDYEEGQVYVLQAPLGYQLTIAFGAGEQIETVALGNAASWQATPSKRGDLLFIKPTREATQTNLTVVTQRRRFVFMLEPLMAEASQTPLFVRFASKPATAPPPPSASAKQAATWRVRGDRLVSPLSISDDGQRTRIVFAKEARLPAIFTLEAGEETLVEGGVEGATLVLEGAPSPLIFRNGKLKATAVRVAPRDARPRVR